MRLVDADALICRIEAMRTSILDNTGRNYDRLNKDELVCRLKRLSTLDIVLRIIDDAALSKHCENCARNADNDKLYPDDRTRCPIQEHYGLPKDGCCHLFEERGAQPELWA